MAADAATPPAPEPAKIPLKQILIADSVEAASALEPTSSGEFLVLSGPVAQANRAELERRLIPGKGQIITDQLLTAMVQVVTAFYRQSDFPIAEVVIPPQSIAAGAVRLAVMRGKFRQIKFAGNRWFSDALLRETLQVRQGEIIRMSELDRAVNWANNNPFRRIKLHVEPVANTGEADLHIGVEERLPIRLTLSYDNTGNEILGIDRYTAALTYGNLWGRDHQGTYQFTTSHDPRLLQAHALDYRIPLPWRHIVSLSANMVQIQASLYEGYFNQDGRSYNSELKYVAPARIGPWIGEVSAALSFKQSNNNLEFGGTEVLGSSTDIFNATFGLVGIRPDKRGRWIASGSFVGSPGNINSRNTEAAFADSRYRAQPSYAYLQGWVQRLTFLAPTLSLSNRAMFQFGSSTNLLSSEHFSIGGVASVRGYKERIFSGESGFVMNHELQKQLPAQTLFKKWPPLESSLSFFYDHGRTQSFQVRTNEPKNYSLRSVGLTLRFNIGTRFGGAIDYGRQATAAGPSDLDRSRLHTRFTLTY